jgi:hypothetical protein
LDDLNSKCRISFVGLPRNLEDYCDNEDEFEKQAADFKQLVRKKTNGAFEVKEIWKKKKGSGYLSGWSLLAINFPKMS